MDIQPQYSSEMPSAPGPHWKAAFMGLVTLLVIAGVFVLAAHALHFWPYGIAEVSPSPSVSASPDSISDWKTYTNTQYGFELKYPSDMQVDANAAHYGYEALIQSSNSPDCDNYQPQSSFIPTCYEITVRTSDTDTGITPSMENGGVFTYSYLGPVSLGGVTGRQYDISLGPEALQGETPPLDYMAQSIIVKHSNKYYELKFGVRGTPISFQKKFNQILSTFKFTDSTVSLKTYTSTAYKYTFDYPSDYQIVAAGTNSSGWDVFSCGEEIGICAHSGQDQANRYNGTDYNSDGFTVKILDKAPQNYSTETACYTTGAENGYPVRLTKTVTIHGTTFFTGSTGGAAAGTQVGGQVYRVFRNNKCWELANNLTTSGLGAVDSIVALSATQGTEITARLDAMVNSFQFTK